MVPSEMPVLNGLRKPVAQSTQKMIWKKAVLEVKNGSTFFGTSKKFSVPDETVRRRSVKSPSHQVLKGRSSYLINEEEMCIEVALQYLG